MTQITPQAREDIQGFILSGYGHLYHSIYLFLQIEEAAIALTWIKNLLPEITTAKEWPHRADGSIEKPEITLNIAFTHSGLAILGLPQYTLDTFSREFIEGMVTDYRSQLLGDSEESAPENWEFGGSQNPTIHILLILHGLTPELLQQKRDQLLQNSPTGVKVIAEEIGFRALGNKEHFGFNDSVSQPSLEGDPITKTKNDFNQVRTGEFILGYPNQYDILPGTPVVPINEDKNNILPSFPGQELSHFKDFGCHGTYLIYRKLEQKVAQFWQFMADQGRNLKGDFQPQNSKLIASKCVGRWPSGTPLVLSPEKDNPQIKDKNQFVYLPEDEKGFACPVGAHIRRTNPRDSFLEVSPSESLTSSNRHRIIRRGALFGEPLFPLDNIENDQLPLDIQDDGKSRGLHFICLCGEISRQFEFMQQTWVNNSRFNGLYDNKDPIIGDHDGSDHMEIPMRPLRQRVLGLPRFVTVRGGGYFFLPSLTAMKFLVNSH